MTLLLRRASVAPGREVDLWIAGGRLVAAPGGGRPDEVVDLGGRPVLAGLADHHLHLFALAAARASVDLSPPALAAAGGLAGALRRGRRDQPEGWLRGIGYDVATSGPLDRRALDRIAVGPVRVQDRTGILWVLDSRGLAEALPADRRDWPAGVEQEDGEPTGSLVRLDRWLGARLPSARPDLAPVGAWLAARGVTAVTDAGADNGAADLAALAAAGLPQRVTAMTREPEVAAVPGLALGPVKVLLDDADLPPLDALADRVAAAHRAGRAVAVHCVTPVQVVLALAAGLGRRDRIEHASLVPDDLLPGLVRAGPTLVVQPGLVRTRGDRYLRDVEPGDRPGLHRLGSLLRAGLPVAASSDAPYGSPDPWLAVAAAADRATAAGAVLGPDEAVPAPRALALLQGRPDAPAVPRSLVPGQVADLVVLDDGWDRIAARPRVLLTAVAGTPVHGGWPAVGA